MGFSVPSIIVLDFLWNTICLLEQVQKVLVCDLQSVDFDPFGLFLCFKVCACDDRSISGCNRLICLKDFSDLSYSCQLERGRM